MRNVDFLRQIFVDQKLYFARVSDFNDPFDCRFTRSIDGGAVERKAYAKRVIEQNCSHLKRPQRRKEVADFLKNLSARDSEVLEALEADWVARLEKIGICSFSKVNNEILMWSHYADSHEGICLEFLDDPDDQFFGLAFPVVYSHDYPVINLLRDSETQRFEKALLTKSDRWSYEREYRSINNLMELNSKGNVPREFPKGKMTGVIFGCKATSETVSLVRSLCEEGELDINFYKAEMDNLSYSLNIVDYE